MRHLTVQQLSASLDGALVGVSLELVVRHLATCRECRDRHARLSKQDDTLRHLLAWDPGAEYFEDASIRLETILDAESRGVAPPRIAEIEAHLPRVTLDEVLRSAQAATATPMPEPSPAPRPGPPLLPALESIAGKPALEPPPTAEPAPADTPAMQFPAWMHPTVDRPVAPRPVPREPRKPTTPIVPVVLARKEPPVIVPVSIPEPEPVRAAEPEPVRAAEPEPVAAIAPEPKTEPTPTLQPRVEPPLEAKSPAAPQPAAARHVLPRWVRPVAFAVAGFVALIAALSALPPVIRIPEPELPRLPRIELVKRQPRAARPETQAAAAPQRPSPATAVREVPPVTVATIPSAIQPATPAAEPRDEVVHETPQAAPLHTPIAPANPAPVRPASMVVAPGTPTPALQTGPATASTPEPDPAADWPLLCGEVLDDTGTPVAGARVLLADLDLGARTDKRGRFCLAAPPGDRTLSVVALGFAAARQVVSLGTQTLEVRIALHPAP